MIKTVYKYVLDSPVTTVTMPEGATVLDVGSQYGTPTIWALIDPFREPVERTFVAVPTGGAVEEDGTTYVGSAHGVEGWMVFHIFERSN